METLDSEELGGRKLSSFPGYERARPVEEVDVENLSERAFREDFVRKNRPVVVKGAAQHWPACRWDEITFRRQLNKVENLFARDGFLITEPFGEYQGGVLEVRRRMRRATPSISGEAFLKRLDGSEQLTAYAVPLKTPGLEPFEKGLGKFGFIDPEDAPARLANYASRVFVHRESYTDWHLHQADETLTVQLLNPKEILLLPTDRPNFTRLWRTLAKRPGWEISAGTDPEFETVTPQRVLLQPGDAIYIPVFWWHAVESVSDSLGATVAFTFASPQDVQFDPRFAAARLNLKMALAERRQRKFLPLMLLGACSALLRHPIRPQYLYRAAT
jgi:hypothetical protein